MSLNRAFTLIRHLAAAAKIEEDLFEETDKLYIQQFQDDFQLENQFIEYMNIRDQHDYIKPLKSPKPVVSASFLKKLHKKLAIETHPDLHNGKEEEFKDIQRAYENGDSAALLASALEHEVDVEVDAEDVKHIMQDIANKRKMLEAKKNTFRWAWGESDKSKKSKKMIRAGLLIDEDEFQEWIKKNKPHA